MADEITEQLLGAEDRSSWCGDTDPTGRYVCQRIRDHALDWHAARNDAGGIHQWKAADAGEPRENMPAAIPATSDPAGDPIGTVRVHPDDDPKQWDARRVMFVSTRTERPWWAIAGDPFGLPAMSHDEVRSWQPQPLADLAVVLGHAEPSVDVALRERLRATNESLLAMLERMETLHVTFTGPDGEELHPDWCRECRVAKVQAALGDLERQRDAWWNQRAAERDALSRMLRGMAQRATALRRGQNRRSCELGEAQAEVESFCAATRRLASLFWLDPEDHQALDVLGRITEQLAAWRTDATQIPEGWQSLVRKGWGVGASRLAIPADAEQQLFHSLRHVYHAVDHGMDFDCAAEARELLARWLAPVSGSDTTAAECDGSFTCPAAEHADGCFVWPAELLNAPVQFWLCPVPEHREHSEDRPVTVEWRDGVAHCTAPGCDKTSAPVSSGGDADIMVDGGQS